MKELVLHPRTEKQVAAYISAPGQVLILLGGSGSGKAALAHHILAELLQTEADGLATYPYFRHVTPAGKSIGIEAIRELESFLSLKVPGKRAINRAILIEDAQALTLEAQNAFLKMLEEPPEGTITLLTANAAQTLLPTIRSRAQTITVQPPTAESLQNFLTTSAGASDAAAQQAVIMSGSLPGLAIALLQDESHALRTAADQARNLLRSSLYERLLAADSLAKDKELFADTVYILQQMARLSLRNAEGAASTRWQNILEASYAAGEALEQNAQPKLLATRLMLHL